MIRSAVRVLPSERGRGIGSELVEAAADAARALGTDSMWGVVQARDEGSLRFATARFVEVGRDVELTGGWLPATARFARESSSCRRSIAKVRTGSPSRPSRTW
jgi:L-amino acid N-acyltransferase YncA